MDAKSAPEAEFNSAAFEKRLQALKDSQESINNCCHWCLENRSHHKKIVSSWLNVLKRVKVEQRVTLFYLANDVIQYSKRRNYEFVESWGTTLQKATTMVRDERVKHKVLRIFKIWEQRGIYNEEFIADLSGLISATPAKKSDDPHEFQASYLINKIKNCTNLENDTDAKLKKLKEHNPKIQIEKLENLCASLKDRAHVDDVEKEIDDYAVHIEDYVNALKAEIKARTNLISLLVQADTQLESDRKDVKLVASAYKTFGTRVKNVKKKLDELLPTLSSPIPSPDINAPSPSPDSDLDLPGSDNNTPPIVSASETIVSSAATTAPPLPTQVTSAGYYNQLPITSTDNNAFSNNNNSFSSFIGSTLPFDLQSFSFNTNLGTIGCSANTQTTNSFSLKSSLSSFFQALVQPPPPPEVVPPPVLTESTAAVTTTSGYQGVAAPVTSIFQAVPPPLPPAVSSGYQYGSNHMPLLPPPMPPFSKEGGAYGNGAYCTDVYSTATAPSTGYCAETPSYDTPIVSNYHQPPINTDYQTSYENPPPPTYNQQYQQQQPASIISTYDTNPVPPTNTFSTENNNQSWNPSQNDWNTDTPESPPTFEKESYSEPIEYHDNAVVNHGGDVDHRILRPLPTISSNPSDSMMGHRGAKDVDHRNLISLTGSPADNSRGQLQNKGNDCWGGKADQDYRITHTSSSSSLDQDYRMPPPFDLEQLKLPPPPPPPNNNNAQRNSTLKPGLSPRKMQDNVESIDMDLSDDDLQQTINENIKVLVDATKDEQQEQHSDLMPPPPFPDLSDDVDANNLLDDLNNDLISGEFNENVMDAWMPQQPPFPQQIQQQQQGNHWNEDYNNGFNRGRGNVKRASGNNWGQRGNFEFRGRGRGFPRGPRGGMRGFINRARGRPGFRGNFRGGF